MTAAGESGIEYEPLALEAIERRFWRELSAAVPEPVAAEHGVEWAAFGTVEAGTVRDLASHPVLNLVLGATEPGAVAGGDLASALAWTRERGVRASVPVAPEQPTTEDAEALLRDAGLAPGEAWARFVRDAHLPRFSPAAEVEVAEVRNADQEPFGTIVATGFGLPAWAAAFFASLPGREGWRCYVARLDGVAHAAAAMLLDDRVAKLGLSATLEPARGRGCQLALLHRRIIDAADAGARTLFVETAGGESDAAASRRNVLRAGFERAYDCPVWADEPA